MKMELRSEIEDGSRIQTESIQAGMTTTDSHGEKPGSNNQLPQDDLLEGTSARTRPLSFDDIMLRRKNKGDAANQVSSALGVTDIGLAPDNIGKAFDSPECHRQINNDSETMDEKNKSNDSRKVRSGRRGVTNAPRKSEKLNRVNEEESLDPDAKSKNKGDKNLSSNRVSQGKNERENHGTRKKDGLVSIDSDNAPDKRKDRDSYLKDKIPERSRVKSEIVKKHHNEERQVYRKRKTDGRMSSDSDNECRKKNAKDLRQTDKLTGKGREKPENENKGREKPEKENRHKHHHEEDKTRARITVKKNDLEKKGTEPTRNYLEETRSRRKRSRSREYEKDRGRRSLSKSPKAYKHTLKDRWELGEPASQTTKDRSGREYSDVDKKRISGNGSGNQYRRNTHSSSGLGGYSPRKRKTDAAAKTPSPTRRSPERRTAGWDLQPVEKESIIGGSTPSNLNTTSQDLSFNIKEFPSVIPVTSTVMKPIGISLHNLSPQMHALESIQLTQATRPMRRLYVENLPASASEEDLKEWINKLLLSSGGNYIQQTQPCISCIIHKEKSQALLEFLTPEDASSALSLDGMSFSGFSLKLRRPKDYANVTTGVSDKSVGAVVSISDIVEDSPNKIFIGGISKLVSSRMLLEIARAFGPVKAFHFEFIADINEPCAFLEYVDHSVTPKACAGLNGMRLGGQFLTAVLATPEPVVENVGKLPIYGIPEHAKPLLEKPTAVLKLKNVLDPEYFMLMSESELEEVLQDIKLECSRFGTVKSVNVAKTTNSFGTMEAYEVNNKGASTNSHDLDLANRSSIAEQLGESTYVDAELDRSEPSEAPNELKNNNQTLEDKNGCDNSAGISDLSSGSIEPTNINRSKLVGESLPNEMIAGDTMKDEICKLPINGEDVSVNDPPSLENPGGFAGELKNQQNATDIELESNYNTAGSTCVGNFQMENKPLTKEELKPEEHNAKFMSSEEELKLEENNPKIVGPVELDTDERKKLDAPGKGDTKNISVDLGCVFEPGSVFVEYRRAEAACMAAHCLHGRTFDGRLVMVEYIDHDLYQMRFRRLAEKVVDSQ